MAGPAAFVLLVVAGLACTARAEPERCRLEIVRQAAKYTQAVVRARAQCTERVLRGLLAAGTDCRTAAEVIAATSRAETVLTAGLTRRCCGPDRVCGSGDDDGLAALGWGTACPDLGHRGCALPLADVGDVAACLACIGRGSADVMGESLLDPLVGGPSGGMECQRVIARAVDRLARKRSKVLATCWAARASGGHLNPCPDPGDGKAAGALAALEEATVANLCKVCGGADRACGGADDLTPTALGALATCPDVSAPGGDGCTAPVSTLTDLIDCVSCITRFASDCSDRAAVPAFTSYPAECNPPAPTLTPGALCSTALECPTGYGCLSNGAPTTRYCVAAAPCPSDGACGGAGVCRPYCTTSGCGPAVCLTPGFSCAGADVVCIDDGGLACRKLCSQDSDCTDPFGLVCINPGFGFGVCIGITPCQ